MFILLKATFALFCLIDYISSRPMINTAIKTSHQESSMKEMVKRITNISSGAQIPCNNTRVMRVKFTDPKVPESEKLCQASEALKSVTKCKGDYEPILSNLLSLHERNQNCSLENGDEIYLRNFLPQLGNYTQGLIRNLRVS
uniref:Interleukin-4 n=1 Tax=Chrysemys picta bellii TaxID=8478 RepID=A0A8C3HT04_CHRPI